MDFSLHDLAAPSQIVLVDLLLGADNAMMIGLAARSLAPEQRKRATIIGVAAAVVLRLVLSVVSTSLLGLPFVKLIGAVVLTFIAVTLSEEDDAAKDGKAGSASPKALWAAAGAIVVADVAMSVDNVIALAAIANGSYVWLFVGVALSVPMLGYGGLLAAEWLRRMPGLVAFGAAMLGWVAGEMAVSDAWYAAWVESRAPYLTMLAPALAAAFVFLYGWLGARLSQARASLAVARVALVALVAGVFVAVITLYGGRG